MSPRAPNFVWTAVLAVVLLGSAGRVEAGCREGTPCRCGDKVRGTVTLGADLVDCGRVGLKLTDGAVLDCAGHEIRGAGPEKSENGLRFDDVTDAEVRNCRIRGFRRGVRLRGGSGNRVLGNTLEGNGVGIEVAGVTSAGMARAHRLERNEIRGSRRNGIHVGGAEKTLIAENRIFDSAKEGLHLDACQGCEVRANTIEGSRAAALYVKHSSDGRFLGNTIRGGLVQLRGDSARNEFHENVISASAVHLQGYRGGRDGAEGDVVTVPRENQFVGGSVEGRKVCFRFEGAHHNTVRGVQVRDCEPARMVPYGDDGDPVHNRVEVIFADGGSTGGVAPEATSAPMERTDAPAETKPLAGLDPEQQERFAAGLAAFERVEDATSGLGPVFNATSCAECHHEPGVGGASDRTVRLVVAAADAASASGEAPPLRTRGLRTADCSVRGESAPASALLRRRISPALYGLGLIEAIPDEEILRRVDPEDRDGDGVSGRAQRIGDRVGRFGWKAQDADLRRAVGRALRDSLGITNPVFPEEGAPHAAAALIGCDGVAEPEADEARLAALVDFLVLLAPLGSPDRDPTRPPEVLRGETVFGEVGCGSCHVAELRTGESAIPALRHQPVRLYSDLLLHDLGPRLADGIAHGEATGVEFRTAPLWGVARRGSLLHDGRAPTLGAAIAAHGGEAAAALDRYLALPKEDRAALIAFLESL